MTAKDIEDLRASVKKAKFFLDWRWRIREFSITHDLTDRQVIDMLNKDGGNYDHR